MLCAVMRVSSADLPLDTESVDLEGCLLSDPSSVLGTPRPGGQGPQGRWELISVDEEGRVSDGTYSCCFPFCLACLSLSLDLFSLFSLLPPRTSRGRKTDSEEMDLI